MNVLAIDTATPVLSVALLQSGESTQRSHIVVRDVGLFHTHSIMAITEALLNDAHCEIGEIDLVACSRGPGSFTGLRIGMATAKGLAASIAEIRNLEVAPLISVPTLDAMAAPFSAFRSTVLPIIDARKKRYYAGLYAGGVRIGGPFDLSAEEIVSIAVSYDPTDRVILTGPDAAQFFDAIGGGMFTVDEDCRRGWARWVAEVATQRLEAQGHDAVDQGPDYFRSSEAEIAHKQ